VEERPPVWIILPVVLSRCEKLSLSFREERRLRVFENRVTRKIYGLKRDEVTRKWRKLHTEELNDLYCSASTVGMIESRRKRWVGHVTLTGENRGAYTVLVRKPE
jgi:hypothetical protein